MSSLFDNHSTFASVYKHGSLPIYKTFEFSFYRCVCFEDWVYGRTVSRLHSNNLRDNDNSGRHSKLFPNEKVSYWADSKSTALAEIKRHGGHKNYITFTSYDDQSSTFPMLNVDEELVIIDGRETGFHEILQKVEEGEELTKGDREVIRLIQDENPDCLAYKSVACKDGVNFLFFEKGFKKLALREVKLYYGENKARNSRRIACSVTSDYSPVLESYGRYFEPIARVKTDEKYLESEEYMKRLIEYKKSCKRVSDAYKRRKI